MSFLKLKLDIEYLLPLVDLFMSLLIREVSGLHLIDLDAYSEQSIIYMTKTNDYSKLIGDTGPI